MKPAPRAPLLTGRSAILVLQALLTAALVCWLVARFDFGRSLDAVAGARLPWMVAGFCCCLGVVLILGQRFNLVLAKGGMTLSLRRSIAVVWIGQFWNFFLPGSTGGDVFRLAAVWSAYPARKPEGVVAVFADRLIATSLLAGGALLGAFALPMEDIARTLLEGREILVIAMAGGAAVAMALAALISPLRRRLQVLAFGFVARLRSARGFFRIDAAMLRVVAWGCAGHVVNFAAFFCFARSVGLQVSFFQVCLFLPMLLVLLIIPVTVNGHGLREVLLLLFLQSVGVASSQGPLAETILAISIVGLSADFVLGLVGGALFLASRSGRARQSVAEAG